MEKTSYKVTAIPSSFVFGDMKLLTDKGAGEAKLFVGPKSKEKEINKFFEFESDMKYRFDKENLLEYMYQVKMEYVFQSINKYKHADATKWNELYSIINELKDSEMYIALNKFVDGSRYYVRADEELFKKTFRKIIIPKLTDLLFVKDDAKNEIVLYLNVNYEFKKSTKDETETIPYNTKIDFDYMRNRIIFGAPGTGKSFRLNRDKDGLLENGGEFERVTFHANYSYANFVGTYKPVMAQAGEISYEYVPGPFMRVLAKALESAMSENPKPYVLIIEEINRANAAAVFGDVFQLLDRDGNGVSEYSISTSQDMRTYLAQKLEVDESAVETIKIPDNMFIWATMNSADQGVFPMDTAFKRRWDFEYIGIDEEEKEVVSYVIPIGNTDNRKYIYWNDLRKAINNKLSSEECKVNEDKLLGPFFISKSALETALDNEEKFVKSFESKVLMYLFEDAMKMSPKKIFEGHAKNGGRMIFSEICKAFREDGIEIFDFDTNMYVLRP